MATANDSRTLRTLAEQLAQLDKRVKAVGSGRQLAHSSIEAGAVQAYDSDGQQVMRIGLQWDGTYAPTVTNGPTPPTPAGLLVNDATEAVIVTWEGAFVGGAVAPMDFLRVDIHIGATSDFLPTYTNRYGSFSSPTGGTLGIHLPYGTYWVKLVCWTLAGVPSLASDGVEGDAWPVDVSSDGFPPASSPDPEVLAGIKEMYVRWTAITNADPVWYDIHVSTTLGFTPDSTTKVGETQSSAFTITTLPGDPPPDGEDDPRELMYDTTYYVRIVARDQDGSAAPSLQAVGYVFRVTGVNLAADSVTSAAIQAGTITGDKFAATVILAGTFKTAEAGQRIETGIAGIQGYKSDGSLMINFPTTSGQTALIDAEIIARGITVTNGMVLRATSTIEPDSKVQLQRGISAPISAPQMATTYTTRRPDTSSLTPAQTTGPLGTFNLIPTEVSCIEWKSASDVWVIHQIRPGGTRAWFFDYDGNPTPWSGGAYFADYVNWEIWSVIELTTSTAPKNGVYRISRWIPTDTYYLQCPQGGGFNRYSRQNGVAPPAVGHNGTDVYVAEVISSTQLNIRYFTPNGDGNNLSAPIATYTSAAGFTANRPLSTVFYHAGAFDTGSGTARYLVAERGYATKNKLVYTSGSGAGSIHPGGVAAGGSSWSSANIDAETFEAATANPRCVAWMPEDAAFWTYGGDGFLYEHTSTFWDPVVTSSLVWAQQTLMDTNATGGTHETTPGPIKSFPWPRRSKIAFSLPPIPTGGVDDPNAIGVYVGRGATQPANSAMWRAAAIASTTTVISALPTSGSNPPTVSTFVNTNPGKMTNDDSTLVISGAGTVAATGITSSGNVVVSGDVTAGTINDPDGRIYAKPPSSFWYLASTFNIANGGANVDINGWSADGSGNSGLITMASNKDVTVSLAGLYEITVGVTFPTNGTGSRRYVQVFTGTSGGSVLVFGQGPAAANALTHCHGSKVVRLTAGSVFRVTAAQDSTTNPLALVAGNQFGYLQVTYKGP